MREPRDFRPQQLYGVTQRGNQGQWVYRDDQDFQEGLGLMRKYAARYGVNIHGWCLMHNHGHWIFEASSEDSISKCDARHAGLLFTIFEEEISRDAVAVVSSADRCWPPFAEDVLALSPVWDR